MRYDFVDLRLFLHVVDTGSLTHGAERAALSLQAASERIRKLEHYFGSALFTRHRTGVELTPAGQCVLDHARVLLQQAQLLEQDMNRFRAEPQQRLHLWCNSSAQSEYLPTLLPMFLLKHPTISIELHEAESSEIIQALEQGRAQLGLVSSFSQTEYLQTQDFVHDPLVLICPATHQFTRQHPLNLPAVFSESMIGLSTHHSLQRSIDIQARALGIHIDYRLRLPNFTAIAEVVAAGAGVAIMPARAASRLKESHALALLPLSGAWANRKLLIVARDFTQLSTMYRDFTDFLLTHRPAAPKLQLC
ncbi:LysR family transcriptional regulator [Acinetobacter soli]|uniref:LysR family transcriptional regulator n=1 Tax=Acinetobacter soli TaxID=487316 RepID=UPI000E6AE212|nr:LysR family transcriptional regulator [Acinetobacter soli]